MSNYKHYPKTWKYSIGCISAESKRICDFVLDRLDKNALSEEGNEVIMLLP